MHVCVCKWVNLTRCSSVFTRAQLTGYHSGFPVCEVVAMVLEFSLCGVESFYNFFNEAGC